MKTDLCCVRGLRRCGTDPVSRKYLYDDWIELDCVRVQMTGSQGLKKEIKTEEEKK